MSPIAKALSLRRHIADVAAYYAGVRMLRSCRSNPATLRSSSAASNSPKIGSDKQQIQACDNCHGPEGAGEPPAIPYLAGQYAHYIAFTLQMWQEGFRKNSPESMAVIAKKLDDQDIAAVAAYYQQVEFTARSRRRSSRTRLTRCRLMRRITPPPASTGARRRADRAG